MVARTLLDYYRQKLYDEYGEGHAITTQELKQFFDRQGEAINDATLYWRAYEWVRSGALEKLGRGLYRLGKGKGVFRPELEAKALESCAKLLARDWPHLRCCLWQTQVLSDFMVHQPAYQYGIIEADRTALSALHSYLVGHVPLAKADFYVWPAQTRDGQLHEQARLRLEASGYKVLTIFIKALAVSAPLQKEKNYYVPTFEKVLVDLYCEPEFFPAYQGPELRHIFRNALQRYRVNPLAIKHYATYRKRWEGFKSQFADELKEAALPGL